jgi:hypothetical protein
VADSAAARCVQKSVYDEEKNLVTTLLLLYSSAATLTNGETNDKKYAS